MVDYGKNPHLVARSIDGFVYEAVFLATESLPNHSLSYSLDAARLTPEACHFYLLILQFHSCKLYFFGDLHLALSGLSSTGVCGCFDV